MPGTARADFLPRFGANYRLSDDSVARFGYARYLMPTTNVRDTLGDFVNQYSGFAQTTTTLRLANGVPRQTLANPFPANQPGDRAVRAESTAATRTWEARSASTSTSCGRRSTIASRASYQKQIWRRTVVDASYFFNLGTRVPYDINLNMADPAFRYEQKTVLNTQVTNPFRNYLTPDKFPGQLRNPATVSLGSLLVPYPQYGAITQTNTDGRLMRTHTIEVRAQRPFISGASFLVGYAWKRERRQEWFDDIAQYRVLQTNGDDGWEWRPTDSPTHRVTTALTVQLPIGRGHAIRCEHAAGARSRRRRLAVQRSRHATTRAGRCSSAPATSSTGDPTLDNPTRDRWFDTSKFSVQDSFTPRSNPWYYDGLERSGHVHHRHDADEDVQP